MSFKVNSFMNTIIMDLRTKKELEQQTAARYVYSLFLLNNKQLFTNFHFLRNMPVIYGRLQSYAPTSKASMTNAIVVILSMYPDQAQLYEAWKGQFEDAKKEVKATRSNREAKMKEQWMGLSEIRGILAEKRALVETFEQPLQRGQYAEVLQMFVLALFVCIEPRRNKDYQMMKIVDKYRPEVHTEAFNYLVVSEHTMVFSKYKTAKHYGTVPLKINNTEFWEIFELYFKYSGGKNDEGMLLVDEMGRPLKNVNAITTVLNKTLGKKIGCNMMRHIYLTEEHGDDIKKLGEISAKMGHSPTSQKDYVCNK